MLVVCVLTLVIVIGIIIIIYSVIKKENNDSDDYFEAEISNNMLKSVSDEFDSAIEQINKLSESVFEEFEEKYQELLFLYQMVDDMKSEIDRKTHSSDEYIKQSRKDNNLYEKNNDERSSGTNINRIYNNPNLEKIKELQKQGLSVSEISKALGIGQGEVKLIMELGRVR